MRLMPLTRLEIVSCMPSETASDTTPRAATKPAGSTPKTGCMTLSSATAQMSARTMLMKIEALGRLEASSTRCMRRTTTR